MSESDADKPDPEIEFLNRLSNQSDDEPSSDVRFLEEPPPESVKKSDAWVVAQLVDQSAPLVTIDVSGGRGIDGVDGRGYGVGSAMWGSDGRDGEDASPVGPGEAGGEIDVTLRPAEDGFALLEGRGKLASGRTITISERVAIGEQGHIQLTANGGPGGNGGNGGDGQDGGRGRDGDDADKRSSGENGEPGGDGGDGGDGTSGGRGGDGGWITVRVSSEDTHLLMLVRQSVLPGRGGAPGRNGRGGAGGRGGDGGDSYSWTTSEDDRYYRDGEWKTRTVTHRHGNSGGFDGRSGSSGRNGNAMLRPSEDGTTGNFRFLVEQGGQFVQYDEVYDLELVDYELTIGDKAAEPSRQIAIRRLTVRNTGGMPTPVSQPVVIWLPANRWVEPLEPDLKLPRSVEPGETYTFHEQVLAARIADVDHVPVGQPLRESGVVAPLARQAGVNRPYARFGMPKRFPIAFPADVESIRSLVSLIPGQAALLRITVTNNSMLDLGRSSEGRRPLGVRIALLNQQQAENLMLLDLQGRRHESDSRWLEEIELLTSGESATIQAIVGVLPGASGYARADLAAVLALGDAGQDGTLRDRHRRDFRLRVAQPYRVDDDAEILLVANHGTTREERNAWEQIANRLGKHINIWDISWEEEFSLSLQRRDGESLLYDFHGGTIVLSNSAFQTVLGLKHGDQFVSQVDLIRALESHGIRLLVLNEPGRDVSSLIHEGLVPVDAEAEHEFLSTEDFLSEIERLPADSRWAFLGAAAEPADTTVQPDPLEQTCAIKVFGVLSPNVDRLRRKASRLQRVLEAIRPGRRFTISYCLPVTTGEKPSAEEEECQSGGWFFTHVHQGTLTVRPTVGDAHPNVIVLPAEVDEACHAQFVSSPKCLAGLIQAMHFREKVHLLDDQFRRLVGGEIEDKLAVDETRAVADATANAILIDLVAEQVTICRTGWTSSAFRKTLIASLQQLHFLAEYPFPLLENDAQRPETRVAVRLAATIELLARKQCSWYEHGLLPWSRWRRRWVLRGWSLKLASALRENFFGTADREVTETNVREAYRDLLRRLKERKRHRRLGARATVRDLLLSPLTDCEIRTDVQEPLPRALHHKAWSALRQAEEQREVERRLLQEVRREQRSDLMVADGGQPLPTHPPEIQNAIHAFLVACAERGGDDQS